MKNEHKLLDSVSFLWCECVRLYIELFAGCYPGRARSAALVSDTLRYVCFE